MSSNHISLPFSTALSFCSLLFSHTLLIGGNEESKICFGIFTPRHAKVIDYWATRLTIGGFTLVTIVMLIQAKIHRDQYEFQLTVGPV